MNINERIKLLRADSGMTLEELAKKIGKTKQTVQKYESGVIANIPSDVIEKLSNSLDTSPAYLMGWTDNKGKDNVKYDMTKTPLYTALNKLKITENDLTQDEINNIVKFVEFIKNSK